MNVYVKGKIALDKVKQERKFFKIIAIGERDQHTV